MEWSRVSRTATVALAASALMVLPGCAGTESAATSTGASAATANDDGGEASISVGMTWQSAAKRLSAAGAVAESAELGRASASGAAGRHEAFRLPDGRLVLLDGAEGSEVVGQIEVWTNPEAPKAERKIEQVSTLALPRP